MRQTTGRITTGPHQNNMADEGGSDLGGHITTEVTKGLKPGMLPSTCSLLYTCVFSPPFYLSVVDDRGSVPVASGFHLFCPVRLGLLCMGGVNQSQINLPLARLSLFGPWQANYILSTPLTTHCQCLICMSWRPGLYVITPVRGLHQLNVVA